MGRIRNVRLEMRIYSNSFFHRVKDWNVIKQIIEQGFNCYYCLEEICEGRKRVGAIGVPMTSFSDVPLSNISQNHYGNCGLGMTRQWGNKQHFEPVLYYPNDKECQSTKMVLKAYQDFLNSPNDCQKYRILGYSKPMKKSTNYKGVPKDNYIEREWRKVYAYKSVRWLDEFEYNSYRGDKTQPKIPVGNILKFSSNDVVFIIIPKKEKADLLDFIINEMNTFGGLPITDSDRLNIISKIVEYESLTYNV